MTLSFTQEGHYSEMGEEWIPESSMIMTFDFSSVENGRLGVKGENGWITYTRVSD